jgi:hypothetical protein
MPKTENAEPIRPKDRRDKLAPRLTISDTESDEPKRVIPKSDIAEPILHMLRSDKVDPRWM